MRSFKSFLSCLFALLLAFVFFSPPPTKADPVKKENPFAVEKATPISIVLHQETVLVSQHQLRRPWRTLTYIEQLASVLHKTNIRRTNYCWATTNPDLLPNQRFYKPPVLLPTPGLQPIVYRC